MVISKSNKLISQKKTTKIFLKEHQNVILFWFLGIVALIFIGYMVQKYLWIKDGPKDEPKIYIDKTKFYEEVLREALIDFAKESSQYKKEVQKCIFLFLLRTDKENQNQILIKTLKEKLKIELKEKGINKRVPPTKGNALATIRLNNEGGFGSLDTIFLDLENPSEGGSNQEYSDQTYSIILDEWIQSKSQNFPIFLEQYKLELVNSNNEVKSFLERINKITLFRVNPMKDMGNDLNLLKERTFPDFFSKESYLSSVSNLLRRNDDYIRLNRFQQHFLKIYLDKINLVLRQSHKQEIKGDNDNFASNWSRFIQENSPFLADLSIDSWEPYICPVRAFKILEFSHLQSPIMDSIK